ncbi:MAG: GxxExxY protein [Pedobacter sp.]|uniref:GxxExxY protein n=1 Tax=Pedobacter sp. TaxID=1411316 RepID=UPI002809F1A7|nr:GxxExxY protein [Pedobacter sp.]MDQ8003747.1 GxxExxY protein [Pedobacter sp.]
MLTKRYLNELTYEVLGSAIEVHKTLGSGLLESVYHECLKEELLYRGIDYQSEVKVPVLYRSKVLDVNLRCDLIVQNCLVVELKSVQEMPNIFDAQLLTYMKLLKCPKGVLINFNCANIFKEGQKTLVNEYFKRLPEQ